ncbi:MAG: hypothetical protein IPK19_23655 [Chloroflexi bacterium]|nr:hypothetical protein [Chloroflexota bacterium]
MIWIGIDGGGSTLRVAAVDDSLRVLAQASRGTANPSSIGREAAAALIQEALREVVDQLEAPPAALGIGVAGASPVYADAWLRETVAGVLSDTPVATATDIEIALIGAHGARRGIIVVAGTGSVAFGVSANGEGVQVGGWGFLIDDAGGGYWIGMEALRHVARLADAGRPPDALSERLLERVGASQPQHIIPWVYRQPPPVREIAALAPLVLDFAPEEPAAAAIVERAAAALANLVALVRDRLHTVDESAPVAFGGGLLTGDAPLARALTARLALPARPAPLYSPTIGAALLAKIRYAKAR